MLNASAKIVRNIRPLVRSVSYAPCVVNKAPIVLAHAASTRKNLKTAPCAFFKTNPSRSFAKWSVTDLPLAPRVAVSHKTIKHALGQYKDQLPIEGVNKLHRILVEIRKENWHKHNGANLDFRKGLQLNAMLQTLLDTLSELPTLQKVIGKVTLDNINGAMATIDDRVNSVSMQR